MNLTLKLFTYLPRALYTRLLTDADLGPLALQCGVPRKTTRLDGPFKFGPGYDGLTVVAIDFDHTQAQIVDGVIHRYFTSPQAEMMDWVDDIDIECHVGRSYKG